MQSELFREQLPEDCPPQEARQVIEITEMFRLVRNQAPMEADFRSQRAERPDATFCNVTECQVRGLSLFAEKVEATRLLRSRRFSGRKICRVRLNPGAGYIEKTGKGSHHTWWPFADYDILAHCRVEST